MDVWRLHRDINASLDENWQSTLLSVNLIENPFI